MKSLPPGRSSPATVRAQRSMLGSQHSAPIPVPAAAAVDQPNTAPSSAGSS
jgi:hypothetical protein